MQIAIMPVKTQYINNVRNTSFRASRAEERRRLNDIIENIRFAYSDDPAGFARQSAPFREELNRLNGYRTSSEEMPDFDYVDRDTVIPMENMQRIEDSNMMSSTTWEFMNNIVRRGPGGEMDRATAFRVNGRTVLKNEEGIRCLKLNDNELPPDMQGTGTFFLDLKYGKVYMYYPERIAVPATQASSRNNASRDVSGADMSYQERSMLLDRLVPIDTYGRINQAAGDIKQRIRTTRGDDIRDLIRYYRATGRCVLELGKGLLKLNDDELLPEMKIKGVDYYIGLDNGVIYADDSGCKEYDMCYPGDTYSYDEDEDTMMANLDYLLVHGIGRIDCPRSLKEDLYDSMSLLYYGDINFYLRSVDYYKQAGKTLTRDGDGIYYKLLEGNELPSSLLGTRIYMNLKDGSLHTENSDAFRGIRFSNIDSSRRSEARTDRTALGIARENGNTEMVNTIENYQPASEQTQKIKEPPFKTERIERELTSIDPAIKTRAVEDLIDYINSDNFDPNFKDNLGRNIIHLSMLSRSEKIKNIIAKAMGKGVDINTPNLSGQTPLMQAIKNFVTAKNEDEKMIDLSNIKFILNQNPDVDAKDKNGQTAFHYVCLSTSAALLTLILSKNPNVLAMDLKGNRGAKFLKTEQMKEIYSKYING